MAGSSEQELHRLTADLNVLGFLGTFDKNFPGFKNPEKWGSAIVNTGHRSSGGVHWLSFAYNPLERKVYVFDPLGWSDIDLCKLYSFRYEPILKQTAQKEPTRCVMVEKNTHAVQCSCAGSCGLFCVYFLRSFSQFPSSPFINPLMDKLHDVPPAIKSSGSRILHNNQDILYRFLRENSQFFRSHFLSITQNTRTNLLFNCT